MSEHQKHTDFLRDCLHYADRSERHDREEKIVRIQRDLRCVQRASWLMATLIALVMASLAYAALLVENFPYSTGQGVINIICTVGVGSLISLITFVGLGIYYRRKLDQQRDECRQLVAKLLESRLGGPAVPPLPDPRNIQFKVGESPGTQGSDGATPSSAKLGSTVPN